MLALWEKQLLQPEDRTFAILELRGVGAYGHYVFNSRACIFKVDQPEHSSFSGVWRRIATTPGFITQGDYEIYPGSCCT